MSLSRTAHVLGSIGLLLVSSLAAMLVTERPIGRGIGYDGHDCCHDCTTPTFEFFECYHTSEQDPCSTTLCIVDHFIYASCQSGAPQFGQKACNTTFDPNAVAVQQWKVAPTTTPLSCGTDNGYIPVPGYPSGSCYWGGTGGGKCFLSSCSGTILEQGADQKGRPACS
jgi:hypothetical protein